MLSPGELRCFHRGLLVGILATLLTLSAAAQGLGQNSDSVDSTAAPAPVGFGIAGISLYTGAEWQQSPAASLSGPSPWLLVSGMAADIDLHLLGRRSQFTGTYRGSYSHNDKFKTFDGFSHTATLDFQSSPSSLTNISLTAEGQSGLIDDSLFGSTYILNLVERSSSLDQLAGGVLGGNVDLGSTPTDLALAGVSRKSGRADAGITHSLSPRMSLFLKTQAARELLGPSQQQLATLNPDYTVAMVDGGLSYMVSKRTKITETLAYTRSYSHLYRDGWASGTVSVERQFGGSVFGSFQAGYQRLSSSEAGTHSAGSYTASGALGTNRRSHRLVATLSRGIGDFHGLGAESSMTFEGAWWWSSHTSSWVLGSSIAYDRIQFSGSSDLNAWMGQFHTGYWLSPHFELSFQAMYLTDFGVQPVGLTFRGARISLLWTPRANHETDTHLVPD